MAAYSVTAANVLASASAKVADGVAGATITAGQPVYIDSGNGGVLKLSDANAAAPANTVDGISLNAASSGQPIRYCRQDPSFTPGFTIAAGAVVVVGEAAGALAPVGDLAAGWYPLVIGVGIGSNKIILNCITGQALKGETVIPA
jgi:hypothetical protein